MIVRRADTGQTWAQVAALQDGSVYVVDNQAERGHVMRMLLAQGKPRNALIILLATDRRADLGRARGIGPSTRLCEDLQRADGTRWNEAPKPGYNPLGKARDAD